MFVKEITATSLPHTHIRIQIKRNAVNNVVQKKKIIKKGSQKRLKFGWDRD